MSELSSLAASPAATQAAPRLAQVEMLDSDGHVAAAFDVTAWPVRIGRALDNDLVLHDPHVAPHHALLDLDADDRVVLHVVQSRNGARIEVPGLHRRIASGERAALPPLAQWRLGAGVLRVRRPQDPLPAEFAVGAVPAQASRRMVMGLVLALLLWFAADLWIGNQPDAGWDEYAPPLLALPFALAAWCGLWGLASKLFTRRFVFLPHLYVVCAYLLATLATELLLALIAYALDWPLASALSTTIAALIGAAMVAHHLRIVTPTHARLAGAAVAAVTVLGLGISMGLRWKNQDLLLDQLYLTTLLPPALRLVDGKPPAVLVDELRSLQTPLLERARELAKKDIEP